MTAWGYRMCTVVYLAEILRQMAIELSPTILIVVAEGITCMRIRNVGIFKAHSMIIANLRGIC